MKRTRFFKVGMKGKTTYQAIYKETKQELEDTVNDYINDGWDLNGDTIKHHIGFTQPLKRTVYE